MIKRILIFLLAIIFAAGCRNRNSFTINGVIKDPAGKVVFLKKIDVNKLELIDTSEVKKNGKFRFRIKSKEPDLYQLGYTESDFITILPEPGEKINLVFNSKNLSENYTVEGSDGTEKVRMLDMRLTETKRKLDSLRRVYDASSTEPGFESKRILLEDEFNNVLKDIRKKNIEFIINNTRSMASLKALYQRIDENTYVLYDPRDLQYLKIVSDSLGRYYPNSRNVKALAEDVKKEMNEIYTRQIQNMAVKAPQASLNPDLKDVNGKRIALSSLKGKVVLLAFWSVDSKECIAENLQLKSIYNTYRSKGFEIYQICLDKDAEKWKAEVRFDELPWINTMEDDPENPKNALLFNVKALPANYLFDRDGTIAGLDLHGRSLQIKLNQMFND